MSKKRAVVIILCCVLFLFIACIAYIAYDINLASQENKKYTKIIDVVNAELKKGKAVEEVVDYIKTNASSLGVISITQPYNSTVFYWDKQSKKSVPKQEKRFEVSCKVHSITGAMSGKGQMNVFINEQNKADGVFEGM